MISLRFKVLICFEFCTKNVLLLSGNNSFKDKFPRFKNTQILG